MDLQVKVHHNQRVEKLFFSTLSFNPPRKESLVCELKRRIPKLIKMTTHMILEYLDDEGDYCVLGDDEHSFQEMLNCAKLTGSDSTCYRLNLKITAAEPSPVEEEKLPPNISSRLAHGTAVRQSRKKLSFVHDETQPHGEHTSLKESRQVTTVSSPLESYVASLQEQIQQQTLKVEAIQRKIASYKGERTPTALISSLPVCSKCHLREGHNRLNCPYPLACTSSVFCKNINKHPEEKTFLKELIKDGTEEGNKLASMREELNIKQQAAARVASRYVNRVKDTIIATDPEKYTRDVGGKVVEEWRKINRDAKILEKSCKGKIPSPEEAKKVLSSISSPPQLSVGKTSVHNPYKMLWNSHGVLWPRISVNRSSTVRTYSQRQDEESEHFVQPESNWPICEAFTGFQDPSPVKSPMRKKSAIARSFDHVDDDYQFALAVQESFKTLPPGFDVEKFERSQPSVRIEINPSESTAVDEQAMSTNPTAQAIAPPPTPLNLDTLADAVSLLEKLPLQ